MARNTSTFFHRQEEELIKMCSNPTKWALLCSSPKVAHTKQNDLSISLKTFIKERWPSAKLQWEEAYMFDQLYVITCKLTAGSVYVCTKRRGERRNAILNPIVSTTIDSEAVYDPKHIELFRAVCLCLKNSVITAPTRWRGVPEGFHQQIANEYEVELMTSDDQKYFSVL